MILIKEKMTQYQNKKSDNSESSNDIRSQYANSAVLRLRGLIYHMRVSFSTKAQKKYYHMCV